MPAQVWLQSLRIMPVCLREAYCGAEMRYIMQLPASLLRCRLLMVHLYPTLWLRAGSASPELNEVRCEESSAAKGSGGKSPAGVLSSIQKSTHAVANPNDS